MKRLYLTFLLLSPVSISFGQTNQSENYLRWSSKRRLTANDFVIKTSNVQIGSSAHFLIEFEVRGFDFMKKNFNRKVQNYLIKSASWVDTTHDVSSSIRYQQTLFDISEIYTRRLRKELKENRKKVLMGTEFVKELNAKAMTDFSNRRIQYDTDTKFGTDSVKQTKWEADIQMELTSLKDFADE